MARPEYSPIVYAPHNLGELNGYIRAHPKATIYAGGTHLLPQYFREGKGSVHVIDITRIEELKRVSRGEGHIEIGAAVSLEQIVNLGRRILPKNLYKALGTIGNSIIREQATLGGNIGVRDFITTLPPILLLMDIRVEIRRGNINRWIPLNRIYSPGTGPSILSPRWAGESGSVFSE